ncbi:MAG: Ppx/GppA phosphatase family protein [Longimicrobiales bacterium]|nr:Ppx/GppA phosphatase family protein [Longimicrobiales bacterium]
MSPDTGAPHAVFPCRLAAVDVGSNAIRYTAAEFVDATHWVDLEVQRLPVRLGHEVFLTGRLDERAMAAAVEGMATFRRSMDNLGIARYRAVATSAVRDARNGPALVDRIRRETGIRLETITGTEEARLIWSALRSRVDLGDALWVSADLGGGSLEVSLLSQEGIQWTESHTMGTVRILEDLGEGRPDSRRFRRLVSEYARTLRFPARVEPERIAGLLATGGNMEALADLAGAPQDARGVSRLPVAHLRKVTRRLARLSVEERVRELGLREDRADVIFPAALIYAHLARLTGVDEIVVPRVGVKEGVLVDLVEDVSGPAVHASRLEQQAFNGALALGRRFQFDELHARHVTRLALMLYDQLRPLHELVEGDRRILVAAAVLHDVGLFVSYRKHHKHSLYLIHNSEIPGLSREDRVLAALVARYHRRAEPKDEHFLFLDLDSGDRHRVRKLAALLRVADALDREHQQKVSGVAARVEGRRLVLELDGRGELLLELWALRKKGRMFRSVFGLEPAPVRPPRGDGLAVI